MPFTLIVSVQLFLQVLGREKVVRQDVEVAGEGSPLSFAEMSMFPFRSSK